MKPVAHAATGKTLWLSEGRQGDHASLVAAGGAILALVTDGERIVFEAGGAALPGTQPANRARERRLANREMRVFF